MKKAIFCSKSWKLSLTRVENMFYLAENFWLLCMFPDLKKLYLWPEYTFLLQYQFSLLILNKEKKKERKETISSKKQNKSFSRIKFLIFLNRKNRFNPKTIWSIGAHRLMRFVEMCLTYLWQIDPNGQSHHDKIDF